jgi:hypothetical protein
MTIGFEIDDQVSHLFKHPHLGVNDIGGSGRVIRASILPSHRPTG